MRSVFAEAAMDRTLQLATLAARRISLSMCSHANRQHGLRELRRRAVSPSFRAGTHINDEYTFRSLTFCCSWMVLFLNESNFFNVAGETFSLWMKQIFCATHSKGTKKLNWHQFKERLQKWAIKLKTWPQRQISSFWEVLHMQSTWWCDVMQLWMVLVWCVGVRDVSEYWRDASVGMSNVMLQKLIMWSE